MTKREEYNLRFHKSTDANGRLVYKLDSSNAVGEYRRLDIIPFLTKYAIESLIENLNKLTNNLPPDPDFLTEHDDIEAMMLTFSNPYFFVGGIQTIHMNDLNDLLVEWLEFISEQHLPQGILR